MMLLEIPKTLPKIEPDQESRYGEWFTRWGEIATEYQSKNNTVAISNKFCKCPKHAIQQFIKNDRCSYLCPIFNNKTHLAWIDIDCHNSQSIIDQMASYELACRLRQEFNSLGIVPEFAQSSDLGNYHIYIWSERPQCTHYVQSILNGFIQQFNIPNNCKVEIGPMDAKKIRPYFMNSKIKNSPQGILIYPGKQVKDFSNLKTYYSPKQINNGTTTATPTTDLTMYTSIEIKDYGDRNKKLIDLVNDSKMSGLNDEQIMKLAEQQFNNGKCRCSLEHHLKACQSLLKNYDPSKSNKGGLWNSFWNTLPDTLSDQELCARAQLYAKERGLRFMSLPVRRFAEYWHLSIMGAHKRIRKLEQAGILKVHERGNRMRATLYQVQ